MVGRGKAVSNAGISGRRAMTNPMQKTPSIGRALEGVVHAKAQGQAYGL
jgi:hypothetical protein